MFRAIYESPLFDPVLFWTAGAAFALAFARRMPFLYGYLVVFTLEILADATLTSAWSPVRAGTAGAAATAGVFVFLGDARYFLLLARARAKKLDRRAWLTALGLSSVVPLASFAAYRSFPAAFANDHAKFLLYEVMLLALALALRARLAGLVGGDAADRRWIARATDFEIAQYALWALADAVILAGHDAGFALRLVPNTMYYVLFLPFVAWAAPRDLVEPWHEARA